MAKGNADNVGSCVEKRSHLDIDPAPMYVRNDIGHKMYREMGHTMNQARLKSTLWVDDVSNKTGDRGRGGY